MRGARCQARAAAAEREGSGARASLAKPRAPVRSGNGRQQQVRRSEERVLGRRLALPRLSRSKGSHLTPALDVGGSGVRWESGGSPTASGVFAPAALSRLPGGGNRVFSARAAARNWPGGAGAGQLSLGFVGMGARMCSSTFPSQASLLSELLSGPLFLVPSEGVGTGAGACGNPCASSLPRAMVHVVSALKRTSRSPWPQKPRGDPQAPGTQILKRGDNNVEGDGRGREKRERGGRGRKKEGG